MKSKGPSWLKQAVFYQIYPQSFYDSNGDGIGDIPGIIQKLDYIESLGVNALWLNPCFVSPFQDAGYDVADFYKVAPRYGTNADLKRLFKEAHKRGIRACLDLVAGHTSVEHPWFKESSRHKKNKYSDRYIWSSHRKQSLDPNLKWVTGFSERDGSFAANYYYCQPALNYGFVKPDSKFPWQQPVDAKGPRAMRVELKKIMTFWLKMGADGFRVDMAFSLVKNDPGYKGTKQLWREMRSWLDRKYPQAVLMSEWSQPEHAISAGFHMDFMIQFGASGYRELVLNDDCFFDRKGGGDVMKFLRPYAEQFSKTKGKGYIAVPSANHDFQRLRSKGRTLEDLKVIMTMLLTWPGVPFVYYGDEIGMRYLEDLPSKEGGYKRTGTRTPMQWDQSKNAGFSKSAKERLYLPIDSKKDRPYVADQERDRDSLLNHVRALLSLRKGSKALGADGAMVPVYAKAGKYPFVYLRSFGREKYLIALNPKGKRVCVDINVGARHASPVPGVCKGVDLIPYGKKMRIKMRGVSYGVWKSTQ